MMFFLLTDYLLYKSETVLGTRVGLEAELEPERETGL